MQIDIEKLEYGKIVYRYWMNGQYTLLLQGDKDFCTRTTCDILSFLLETRKKAIGFMLRKEADCPDGERQRAVHPGARVSGHFAIAILDRTVSIRLTFGMLESLSGKERYKHNTECRKECLRVLE